MHLRFRQLLCVSLSLFSFSSFASSQDSRNSSVVVVEVADVTGAGVPNTEIMFVELSTSVQTVCPSDSAGKATCALAPGAYTATVTFPGFRTSTQRIDAKRGETQNVRFVLQVASCPPGPCIEVTGSGNVEAKPAKIGDLEESTRPLKHPDVHITFPEIHDWNSLRISLSRSPCYGKCPTYEIEIHGDGNVIYDGKANVALMGRHTAKISQASLVELVDVFRKADYFSLSDRYVSGVTDNPAYKTSISFDGVSKSVLDYVGRSVGMPSAVSDVETAIDRLSGAHRWIVGGKQ